jgi:NADH-quinone oxidoreductase subunit B
MTVNDLYEPAGLKDTVVFTTVKKIMRWAQSNSLWPLGFGLACCAIEMMSTSASNFDISRFGSEVFRSSPRQADLLIVPGRLAWKMAPIIKRLYDQMPEPKWVISMGACASSGGVFQTYSIVHGVDCVIPVDIYIPGCPPRPEMLLDGLIKLQQKIQDPNFKIVIKNRGVPDPETVKLREGKI